MGLLSGEQYQLRIFRGPHQNKLDFDVAESLQSHGDRVKYIQSDRHGKNALDFHIAFYMGRLLQELEANGPSASSHIRFVVISKDGGFDALMSHVQSLGYQAMKAASIRHALGLDEPVTVTESAQQPTLTQSPSTPPPISQPSGKPAVAKKAADVKQAAPAKQTASPKKTATVQAKPAKETEKKSQVPVRKSLGPEDKGKVLEHLRLHPKNRPVKRKTLESHITSLLGGNVAPKAVRGLIAGLENEGVVKFTGNKIDEYKIPKRK